MNIVSIISSLLTPAVVARIASALGINPTIAQMAISAALPAILAGLAGKAAQPSSLGVLSGLLGQQNPGILGQIGELIGSTNQAGLVNGGTDSLNALFGQSTTGALAGAVGKFAGVPAATSTSLLGMLAPLALGTLAKEQKAASLDANGLAKLLASQKDNIAAALPKGFSGLLQGTGLLDGVLGAASQPMSASAQRPAPASVAPAPRPAAMPERAAASNGMMRWLPILAALLVGVFAWQYLSNRGPATGTIMVNNVDVGKKTAALYEGIKTSVGGIKDAASANAALPKLREQSAAVLDVREMAEKLPSAGRKELATLVGPWIPALEALVVSAIKVPGAESVVKPVLDQIIERMKGLAKG